MSPNSVNILGVSINSTSRVEVLDEIVGFEANQAPLLVFTPNPEFLVEANKDENFKELLNKGSLNLPDGVGIVWAGKLFGTPIKERVSGADVVGELLEVLSKSKSESKSVIGIAGARRAVIEESTELVKRLQQKYPNINFINLDKKSEILNPKFEMVRQAHHLERSRKTNSNVQKSNVPNVSDFVLRASNFNIVFAAHGMKKQEEWIIENKDRVNANVFMGIGGSLDFVTGFTRRAPSLIRQIGLEWLWRGLQRPSHFKRVWKATVVFGFLVIKEKIKRFL